VKGAERARDGHVSAHLAPVLGASLRARGLARHEVASWVLHLALRGVTSAAVRLGVAGPHEAQRVQFALAATLGEVLAACSNLTPDDAALSAPWHEIVGGAHDRLYSKLFQS
jgi:urease accessory protein